MPLQIVRNDISKVSADVIVMSANPMPVCGGSSDLSIYKAAGYDSLLEARQKIGELHVADVAVTPAFALKAKYVFHTVGPVWHGGDSGEFLALKTCYRESLRKAAELGCESIAFPLISSGVYQFPKDRALSIAVEAIRDFLQTNEIDVTLVVYDRRAFEISQDLQEDVESFIDENYIDAGRRANNRWNRERIRETDVCGYPEIEEGYWKEDLLLQAEDLSEPQESEPLLEEKQCACYCQADEKLPDSLEKVLGGETETFQQKLFNLIREKQRDDVDVYRKANLDRKHFSKIRSNVHYSPKKKTAIALAIALQLNLEETDDLLARAGFALSPADTGDLIVTYFISHQKYDIWELNNVLFEYGQAGLGA